MRTSGTHMSRRDINIVHDDADIEGRLNGAKGELSAQAGIILGIHNIFIVVPQFLATGLSSVIFATLDPNKSSHLGPAVNVTIPVGIEGKQPKDGPNSVAIIFQVGGVSAAIAFVLCWRLARELRHR